MMKVHSKIMAAVVGAYVMSAGLLHAAPVIVGQVATLSASQTVNLTEEGALDWRYWGISGTGDNLVARAYKNVSTHLISNAVYAGVTSYGTEMADSAQTSLTSNIPTFSWTDGNSSQTSNTGISSALNKNNGQYPWGIETGFKITIAASSTPVVIKVYLGVAGGVGTFTASIDDMVLYTDSSITDSTANSRYWGGNQAVYTLTVTNDTSSPVVITWTTVTANKQWAHVTLDAVTVAAAPVPEPSAIGFLGMGALSLIAWRRAPHHGK